MAWSRAQQLMFFRACGAAGLTERQRYSVLRWVGCPQGDRPGPRGSVVSRPSASDARNTQRQFDRAMAVAEQHAAAAGAAVPRPRNHASWADVCADDTARTADRVRRVIETGRRAAPDAYDWDALLEAQVRRMTASSPAPPAAWHRDGSLEGIDLATCLKVLRAVEAVVARTFAGRGLGRPDFGDARARAS